MQRRCRSSGTTVIDGIDFGEGPRRHDGRLWFSDFSSADDLLSRDPRRRLRYPPRRVGTRRSPVWTGWLPDGRLLFVSMLDRKAMRQEADGSVVEHADLSDVAGGHCNDLVVSSTGIAYVGNFGFDFEAGDSVATTTLAIVYPDGRVVADSHELLFPNGAVLSPSESTLMVGETFGAEHGIHDRRRRATHRAADLGDGRRDRSRRLHARRGRRHLVLRRRRQADRARGRFRRHRRPGDDPHRHPEQHLCLHARRRRRPHPVRTALRRREPRGRRRHRHRFDRQHPREVAHAGRPCTHTHHPERSKPRSARHRFQT